MSNDSYNKKFLSKIEKYIYKKLKCVYGKKGAKVYSKLIIIIYGNLATRYNLTVKQLWNCLPLKVIPKRKINGAYGKNILKMSDNFSIIEIDRKKATYNTFIHEFGHYLKKLICFIYIMYMPSNVISNDIERINKFVGVKKKSLFSTFDIFKWDVQQEEDFACTWERYVLNGHPTAYQEIFDDIKRFLMNDINKRNVNEVMSAYSLIDMTDDIKDLFNNFIKTDIKENITPKLSPSSKTIIKRRKFNKLKKNLLSIGLILAFSFLILFFHSELKIMSYHVIFFISKSKFISNIFNIIYLIFIKIKLSLN